MSTPLFLLVLLTYVGLEAWLSWRSPREGALEHAWGWRMALVLLVAVSTWSEWPFFLI